MLIELLTCADAAAAERTLPWTYSADTEERDELEIEHYLTLETPKVNGSTVYEWEHQVEAEYGVSQRLELGLYLVATQAGSGPLTFAGYKARFQYRLGPMSGGVVDPAVYLEYVGTPTLDQHELEGKLILSRDWERVSTALNLTEELQFGSERAFVFEPTGGATYAVHPRVWVGAEAKVEVVFAEGGTEGPFVWAGPVVQLRGNRPDADGDHDEPGGGLSWTLGGLIGATPATREDAAVEVRSAFVVEL